MYTGNIPKGGTDKHQGYRPIWLLNSWVIINLSVSQKTQTVVSQSQSCCIHKTTLTDVTLFQNGMNRVCYRAAAKSQHLRKQELARA